MDLKAFKDKATEVAVKGGVAAASAVSDIALSVEALTKLKGAEIDTKKIADISKQLPGKIGRDVAEVAIVAQEVINTVHKDPRDFQVVRSFFDYNLAKAREVIESRLEVHDAQTTALIDRVIGETNKNFKDMLKKCSENDKLGAQIAAESLSRIIEHNI